jgi:hypothetical protein
MMVQGDDDWSCDDMKVVTAVSDASLDIVIVYLLWCRVTMTAWSCDDTKVVMAVSDASLCVWTLL